MKEKKQTYVRYAFRNASYFSCLVWLSCNSEQEFPAGNRKYGKQDLIPDKSGSLVHLHPVYSHVTQFIEIIELYNEPGHAWSIPKSCSLVINPLFRSLSCDEPCCTIIDGLSLVTNHAITAGLAMSHHYCRSGHVTCHTQPSSFAQAESARAPNL